MTKEKFQKKKKDLNTHVSSGFQEKRKMVKKNTTLGLWIVIGVLVAVILLLVFWRGSQAPQAPTGRAIEDPFDFYLILTNNNVNVTQGNNATTGVIVGLLNGTTQNVDLSQTGCPTGATCTFTPSSGNPTYNSTLRVSTSTTTPAATYNIVITGTGGGVSHSITFTLNVSAPAPFDFALSTSPTSGSVEQGSSATTTTYVSLLSGTTESVSLSSLGCPTGATCTFTPSSGNPSFTSTFRVSTISTTPTGAYPITLTGDSARTTKNTTYTLTVTAPAKVIYSDNFESVFNWGVSRLWHRTTRRSSSPTRSLWYGNETTGTYQTGSSRNFGDAISPSINLANASNPKLTFNSYWNTETGSSYDKKRVYLSRDNGATWTQVLQITTNPRVWSTQTVTLTNATGKIIKIKFSFDTVDGLYNNYEGWFVDDVKVTG